MGFPTTNIGCIEFDNKARFAVIPCERTIYFCECVLRTGGCKDFEDIRGLILIFY
jgi:hypothetical protein